MQELAKALYTFTKLPTEDNPGIAAESPDFTEVATQWSGYCLRSLRGDLLHLGLNIAHSLAEFDRGLKFPATLKD